MRGFHTAALVAVVALALCAGGAADTNTPQTRGAGASNIGTAGARPSLNITTTAERPQGSDAGEFLRGRRPKPNKWHSPSKPDYPSPSDPKKCNGVEETCKLDSDCLKLFPCKFATCVNKHKKKNKKKYRGGRSNEDDEEDHPENYERSYDSGICVCGEENKDGACLPPVLFADDCTSKRTDVGICKEGICTTEPRDDGCPCGTDATSCITADNEKCLYPDQMCKCDGESQCVPNVLPENTPCNLGITLGECEVAVCLGSMCMKGSAELNSACYMNGETSCANAGICGFDEEGPSCISLSCPTPSPDKKCKRKSPGDECGNGNNKGTCCLTLGGVLECDKDTPAGICPCFIPENTCPYDGVSDGGYCCSTSGGLECLADVADCSPATFCQAITREENAGCSPNTDCGTGTADCNEICRQVDADLTCIDEPKGCTCSGIGAGSNLDCGEPGRKPREQKCCFCDSV